MAEEDVIFGKNLHLYGGIEPSNMKTFTVAYLNGHARIDAVLPDDTVIDGQTLCTVAGAVIRKKTTGYPVNEFDGTLVADIKSSQTIQDTDITSITDVCYYAAFPYTTQGVYNRNKSNRYLFSFLDEHYYYGYDLTLAESNPSNRVTYPSDVINADFTPAYMDRNAFTFEYGGWSSISTPGKAFMPKPCILKYGTTASILHYLYPDDYGYQCTYDSDGNPVKSSSKSSVATPGSGGNAMMEWPKIYTHREVVNGVYKFRCSDLKVADDWDCWCNYDKNNNEIDHFYTSIYPCLRAVNSSYNDRMRSISGYIPFTDDNYGYNTAAKYAKVNGDDWHLETLADRLLIQDLLVMMAKTTDCQTAYGIGMDYNSETLGNNGSLNTKGLFYGGGIDTPVKVFGMENWWSSIPRILAGLSAYEDSDNIYYVKMKITRGTYDGSTASDYDDSNGNIDKTGIFSSYIPAFQLSSMTRGYISGSLNTQYGRIPNGECTGSSTTYETDGFDFTPASSGRFIHALSGGTNAAGADYSQGPFSLEFDSVGSTSIPSTPFFIAISAKPAAG